MMFSSSVLSGSNQFGSVVSIGAPFRFVLAVAPLALRNIFYFKFGVQCYNKAHKCAPGGAGHSLRSRRFACR